MKQEEIDYAVQELQAWFYQQYLACGTSEVFVDVDVWATLLNVRPQSIVAAMTHLLHAGIIESRSTAAGIRGYRWIANQTRRSENEGTAG